MERIQPGVLPTQEQVAEVVLQLEANALAIDDKDYSDCPDEILTAAVAAVLESLNSVQREIIVRLCHGSYGTYPYGSKISLSYAFEITPREIDDIRAEFLQRINARIQSS